MPVAPLPELDAWSFQPDSRCHSLSRHWNWSEPQPYWLAARLAATLFAPAGGVAAARAAAASAAALAAAAAARRSASAPAAARASDALLAVSMLLRSLVSPS